MSKQHIIGVTGGIGSGKSRVCTFLSNQYNLPLISLDIICRDLLQQQQTGWQALRTLLPDAYFGPNGELDRQLFRQQLFHDSSLRKRVDAVLHPLARHEMEQQAAKLHGPVFVEIPLLFEAGWQDAVQLIIVVYADTPIRLQRIMQRDQITEEEAKKAVAAQQCLRKKATSADHVIDNSGPWDRTCAQIQGLFAPDDFLTKG
ncbi:MAG: dephospho-CoA kinase [Candidatus Electrothrix sp. ATG2]|nr:dephospho-CoA kinase [Candidatus Electrothrix sp. ATG2]